MSKSSIELKYQKLELDYEALGDLRFIKFDFEKYFTKPKNIGEDLFEEWKECSTIKEPINYFPSIDRSLETFKRGIYNWQMACLLSNYPKTLKIEYSNTQTSVLEQAFMRGEAAAINYLTNDLGFLDENIRLKKQKDWKGLKDFLLYEMAIKIDGCEFNGANFVKSFIPKEGSIDTVYWIGYFTEIVTQCEIIEERHFKQDSKTKETSIHSMIDVNDLTKIIDLISDEFLKFDGDKIIFDAPNTTYQEPNQKYLSHLIFCLKEKGYIKKKYSKKEEANAFSKYFNVELSDKVYGQWLKKIDADFLENFRVIPEKVKF